ncbi:FkbM family methyltransferase [Nitratireductor luteus]|uniref:FkbM family methyltransferase n=1 Tax=Nitratireductor luteus TaxID=2976980 RepID=UPI00223FB944|nr:FkbM family methyltransferase [Nitratireductor luteus]
MSSSKWPWGKLQKLYRKINSIPRRYRPRLCVYVGDGIVLTETIFKRLIYVDGKDISLSPHIMRTGQWEEWVATFYRRELKSGDVVVDIGANCGYLTLLAADLIGHSGYVLAFEPQEKLARLIRNSAAVNGFQPRVSVVTSAVGESEGRARLGHIGDYRGSSSLVPGFGEGDSNEVEVVALDTALSSISKRIDRELTPAFIKVDVEGFEYYVWKGMQRLVNSHRGPLTILLEFTPDRYIDQGQDPDAFLAELSSAGFSLSVLDPHSAMERPLVARTVAEACPPGQYLDLIARRS